MNKTRKRSLIIIVALIIITIGVAIYNRINPPEVKKVELNPKTVALLSDGCINSQNLDNLKDSIEYLFVCDDYDYKESVSDISGYNSTKGITSNIKLSSYKNIILYCGTFDYFYSTEIGDLNEDGSFSKYINDFIDAYNKSYSEHNIYLVNIPNITIDGKNYTTEKNESGYLIEDYNKIINLVANKYENVYVVDYNTATKDNPVVMTTDNYLLDKAHLNLLYENIVKTIK